MTEDTGERIEQRVIDLLEERERIMRMARIMRLGREK